MSRDVLATTLYVMYPITTIAFLISYIHAAPSLIHLPPPKHTYWIMRCLGACMSACALGERLPCTMAQSFARQSDSEVYR